MHVEVIQLGSPSSLRSLYDELHEKIAPMGLELSLYDAQGGLVAGGQPQMRFCQFLAARDSSCRCGRKELVDYILDTGQASRATSASGCCLMGLPVADHSRTLGVVIAEYPPLELTRGDALVHQADRLELDAQALAGQARRDCRHPAAEAPHLMKVVELLIGEQLRVWQSAQAVHSLSDNLASTYEELTLLYNISGSMKVSQSPRQFLQDICDQIVDVMQLDQAAAVVYDERMQMGDDIVVTSGGSVLDSDALRLVSATYLAPRLSQPADFVLRNSIDEPQGLLCDRQVESIIAVPLMLDRQGIGILVGLNKQGADFDSCDAKLLGSIAGQGSVFLANHRMYAELQDLLMGVLHSMTESIDAKDPYTCGHSRRVAQISRRLAISQGLDGQRAQHIYLAGLLHDIGKIGVPEAILCKDGRLTDEEYDNIKRHPAIGARILRRIRHLEPIVAGVLTHHERLDGTGYPKGLAGQEISIEGRIVGLADSWDAMTSHRTYRRALDLDRAIGEIRRCSGTQFDTGLVEEFLSWDLTAYMDELQTANASDLHLLDEPIY